jgi:hypothetical protein
LRGTPPTLTSDDLISTVGLAEDDRLYYAVCANRLRQLLKGPFLEGRARLIGIRLDQVDVYLV